MGNVQSSDYERWDDGNDGSSSGQHVQREQPAAVFFDAQDHECTPACKWNGMAAPGYEVTHFECERRLALRDAQREYEEYLVQEEEERVRRDQRRRKEERDEARRVAIERAAQEALDAAAHEAHLQNLQDEVDANRAMDFDDCSYNSHEHLYPSQPQRLVDIRSPLVGQPHVRNLAQEFERTYECMEHSCNCFLRATACIEETQEHEEYCCFGKR